MELAYCLMEDLSYSGEGLCCSRDWSQGIYQKNFLEFSASL